ncbi:hypothetical protein [Enterovirga sp.]|jgi:hypothetical protein|uniref:hypothetical protein n=1 Tax=Enterovirga sp. TaxID=2026350 RepID=UPI00262D49B1|nr:hypothetical protein [Enterovirga sp.]MDB5592059.1 hypothetical protein [Enterovirga sp.]
MAQNGSAQSIGARIEARSSDCRDLVVVGASPAERHDKRPLAGFITQLIACRSRVPAFRRAGRAEPSAARHSYGQQAGWPARGLLDLVV